jgi:hypothetical protein
MSGSIAQLSEMLADVVKAVVSAQTELDRVANQSPGDLPLAPLAFIVRQTEVTLQGTVFSQRTGPIAAQEPALSFALTNRVQASLGGSDRAALSTRVSVSIQAIEPHHGS